MLNGNLPQKGKDIEAIWNSITGAGFTALTSTYSMLIFSVMTSV
jgi:hypothetical protein